MGFQSKNKKMNIRPNLLWMFKKAYCQKYSIGLNTFPYRNGTIMLYGGNNMRGISFIVSVLIAGLFISSAAFAQGAADDIPLESAQDEAIPIPTTAYPCSIAGAVPPSSVLNASDNVQPCVTVTPVPTLPVPTVPVDPCLVADEVINQSNNAGDAAQPCVNPILPTPVPVDPETNPPTIASPPTTNNNSTGGSGGSTRSGRRANEIQLQGNNGVVLTETTDANPIPVNPRGGISQDIRQDPAVVAQTNEGDAHTANAEVAPAAASPATGLLTSTNAPLIGLIVLIIVGGLYLRSR